MLFFHCFIFTRGMPHIIFNEIIQSVQIYYLMAHGTMRYGILWSENDCGSFYRLVYVGLNVRGPEMQTWTKNLETKQLRNSVPQSVWHNEVGYRDMFHGCNIGITHIRWFEDNTVMCIGNVYVEPHYVIRNEV